MADADRLESGGCRCRLGSLSLLLLLLATAGLEAQSTSRRSFLARSDVSGSLADCSLLVPDTLSSIAEQRSLLVRPRSQAMSVFSLAGVGLTAAQADTTLDAASALLQTDDTDAVVNDTGCCVEMRRSGGVGVIGANGVGGVTVTCGGSTVTIPGGVITTANQLNTVECASGDQAGDVVVVNGLTFCGVAGNFNGCAQNNQAMVVVTAAPSSSWAHEFGHVQGLNHNPACTGGTCGSTNACTCATAGASARNIMFCQGCAGRDTITANECSAYRSNATP